MDKPCIFTAMFSVSKMVTDQARKRAVFKSLMTMFIVAEFQPLSICITGGRSNFIASIPLHWSSKMVGHHG